MECLRLRDEEEEGYEIGYGRRSCTFLFSCFREKRLYDLFLEEHFSCFLKLWRGTMDGRRMEETNSGKKEIGDLCIQNE